MVVAIVFQFHKGTIKTYCAKKLKEFLGYFNSIKVQLKLLRQEAKRVFRLFQFHKGTIKTRMTIVQPRIDNLYFNSIKVQLKQTK